MGSTDLSWTEFFNVVDGKNRSSDTFYQGTNAATGEKLWDVPVASKQDTEDAILAARHAFKSWSAKPFEERRTILKKLGEGLKPYLDDFEELLLKESAKPVSLSQIKESDHFL
jgi:acyl-CoA reductase-like NAD-dependent aldehyde dehydrogenase